MAMGLTMPSTGPISAMPSGANTSNLTTPAYDNGGGFHQAMPKVDFFGDLANPYQGNAGRPEGSFRKEESNSIPATRIAGLVGISPHIDNDQAFSMMGDLGARVSYGDEQRPSDNLIDRDQRLATFNSSGHTGANSLTNNATTLPAAGPIGRGLNLR